MVNVKEKNVEKELTVSKGDTFISLISSLGLDYNQAHALYSKFKKIYDPASLRIGQKIIVSLTEDIQTHEMLSLDSIVIEPKSGQRYHLGKKTTKTNILPRLKKDVIVRRNQQCLRYNSRLFIGFYAQTRRSGQDCR